ncbi:hypothetical protein CC78DRAFT_620200 [Lojkania enalia]|uniref:Uncharacterized protein n=1 Tax=Lojkania enalia TaxID=147567 RepID=A0A9P4K1M4_9PLEO|nr:hypothetical protein CC78DRAFT_620200 [Didymosphaeria enalia]
MGNSNGLRTVFLITPPLFLLPLSCLTFALERIANGILNLQTGRYLNSASRFLTLSFDNTTPIDLHTNYGPTAAIIAISVLAFVVSVIGFCGIWELRHVEGTARHQRIWSWAMLLVNFAMLAAIIGVFGWTSAVQENEKWNSRSDAFSGGRFTKETWACQIDRFFVMEDWAGPACVVAQATRYSLIPLAVAVLLVIVSTFVLVHIRGGIKWLLGGKGRYGAFDSIYEMQPQKNGPFISA